MRRAVVDQAVTSRCSATGRHATHAWSLEVQSVGTVPASDGRCDEDPAMAPVGCAMDEHERAMVRAVGVGEFSGIGRDAARSPLLKLSGAAGTMAAGTGVGCGEELASGKWRSFEWP